MKHKSKAILMSARANAFYLQHVRVCQDAERVVYLARDGDIDRLFNIPEKNTAFILLGKGTSITDSAARKLAESGVLLGFCGSGGSPLLSSVSPVFLEPHSEYRPTEYMQQWAQMWFDEEKRMAAARFFLKERIHWACSAWSDMKLEVSDSLIKRFEQRIDASKNTTELLSAEAEWAKGLYRLLATHFKISDFTRQEGVGSQAGKAELINSLLDHGNYIAYGYAATALTTLGIAYAFPLLHGKTRRGALVFDVADLFKDAIVMSLAFTEGSKSTKDQEFRYALIEKCWDEKVLDRLFNTIKKTAEEFSK